MLLKLMERWPIIITIGAGLLGFVAGEMAWDDSAIVSFTSQYPSWSKYAAGTVGAVFVIGLGRYFAHEPLAEAAADHIEHLGAHPEHPTGHIHNAKVPPTN
jgi:predicted tellurium resistance membrane protein TerC